MTDNHTCATCESYHPLTADRGQCRASAPLAIINVVEAGLRTRALDYTASWPGIPAADPGCSAHTQRQAPAAEPKPRVLSRRPLKY